MPSSPEAERAEQLFDESDRGCALVGAALLDDALEQVLRALFADDPDIVKQAIEPLFATFGPLSSFSAKIRMAYALRAVTPAQFRDLEVVRRVRNAFAHSHGPADFSDHKIETLIKQLHTAQPPIDALPKIESAGEPPEGTREHEEFIRSRALVKRNKAKFAVCAVELSRGLAKLASAISAPRSPK